MGVMMNILYTGSVITLLLFLGLAIIVSCEESGSDDSSNGINDDGFNNDDDNTGDDEYDNDSDDDEDFDNIWIDELTGHMWEKTSHCCYEWYDAYIYCEALTLGDFKNWRLPTISELRSLIRGCPATETGGKCGVTDDCASYGYDDDDDYYEEHEGCWNQPCIGCTINEGPAGGCYWPSQLNDDCTWFWSSTPIWDDYAGGSVWLVSFDNGEVLDDFYASEENVRCVRFAN